MAGCWAGAADLADFGGASIRSLITTALHGQVVPALLTRVHDQQHQHDHQTDAR